MENIKKVEKEVKGKQWEEAIEKALEKANAKVTIDGFRKGKAPKEVFLKKYGVESLYFDAADLVIDSCYEKVMKENLEMELVSRPDVSLKSIDDKKVVFIFTLTGKPEVKLGKYKGLGVKKEKAEVTKKEIEEAIDSMRQRYAENVLKEGKVAKGDIAVIDFEGFVGDTAFEGGKGENYPLTIGSGSFIPGFEEQLIGLKAGDKKDVVVTFPKDYQAEELKGKEATFKVTVNEVKEIKVPELDKDFFEDLGYDGVDTKEALEAQISENLLTHKESEIENKYLDDLLDKAIEKVEVEIPEVMIKDEKDRMMKQYEQNLQQQGINLEMFYQYTNSNEDALREQMTEEATKRIKIRLTLEEIAKQEKIEITDKEAEKETKELAKKYQMEEEEFKKAFGGLEMVKYDLQMRKAMDLLKD